MNWVCHRTKIFPITLQCLFPKMALPVSLFPKPLLSECIIEVVLYNSHRYLASLTVQRLSSTICEASLLLQPLLQAGWENEALQLMKTVVCPFRYKEIKQVFLPSFPFSVEFHIWDFSQSQIFTKQGSFLLSCQLFLLYLNQKWLADQNCLKSLLGCMAEYAARTATEALGTLNYLMMRFSDSDRLTVLGLQALCKTSFSLPNNQ